MPLFPIDVAEYYGVFSGKCMQQEECCKQRCFFKLRPLKYQKAIQEQLEVLGGFSLVEPPDLRNRLHKAYVLSIYNMLVNEAGNLTAWRVPNLPIAVCQTVWLHLMGVESDRTFRQWKVSAGAGMGARVHTLLAPVHGVTGNQSATKTSARQHAERYLQSIADEQGFCLPHDLAREKDAVEGRVITFLPGALTLRSLFEGYEAVVSLIQDDEERTESTLTERTFASVLEGLPWIRLSQRQRGLCDTCLWWREHLRGVTDDRLNRECETFGEHLKRATTTREVYRVAKEQRSAGLCMLTWDYARQVTLPSLRKAESMGEFFTAKFGYNVNVFGVVEEHSGASGVQWNMLSGEGAKHDPDAVCSQLHYFLETVRPELGTCAEVVCQSDSTSAQNKNNKLLVFWAHRVMLGKHRRVRWNFAEVGHTKSRCDEGFGVMRQAMARLDVFGMPGLLKTIDDATKHKESSRAVLVPPASMLTWAPLGAKFHRIDGVLKQPDKFVYQIVIELNEENHDRKVNFSFSLKPDGTELSQPVRLTKSGIAYRSVEAECQPVHALDTRLLSDVRIEQLNKDVFRVVDKRPDMPKADRDWWKRLLATEEPAAPRSSADQDRTGLPFSAVVAEAAAAGGPATAAAAADGSGDPRTTTKATGSRRRSSADHPIAETEHMAKKLKERQAREQETP